MFKKLILVEVDNKRSFTLESNKLYILTSWKY